MKKLLLLSLGILFLKNAIGQEVESYWKTDNVTRIDNKEIWGVTLSYMEMLANMQIHLTKHGDLLKFSFPDQQEIKLSQFKSITNCRLKQSGELLDSVYAVESEPEKLKIMFHYAGRDGENRFAVNLLPIESGVYFKEVEKLRNERKKLLELLVPLDLSGLNLSLPIPSYFNPSLNLDILNPIQLAEDLCDIEKLRTESTRFDFTIKGEKKYEFNHYAIQNSASIGHVAAKIGNLNFDNLALVTSSDNSYAEALMVSKKQLDGTSIQALCKLINAKLINAKIEKHGLPNQPTDDKRSLFNIASSFGLKWIDGNNIVEIVIQTPKEVYQNKIDENIFIESYKYEDNVPNDVILKVFNHYLSLVKSSDIKIYIVSKEFGAKITSDELSGSKPSFLGEFR